MDTGGPPKDLDGLCPRSTGNSAMVTDLNETRLVEAFDGEAVAVHMVAKVEGDG